ncbi:MAG: aminomethyl-transferring glycine dehydrogenase [Acidimicrobiales bacterium]
MTDAFVDRHIGLSPAEEGKMLADLGYSTAGELLRAAVPETIRQQGDLTIGEPVGEADALAGMRALAQANRVYRSLIGMGWNDCVTPAVLRRNLMENPAWYTSYTPYQPEISQGRLEMLLTFQTMVADLTGCEIANASMLDEATAAAEAMTMLRRLSRTDRNGFFVDAGCHPQTLAVVATRARPLGIDLIVGDPAVDLVADQVYGALIAHPASTGEIRPLEPVVTALHDADAMVAVTTDLLACCLVTPPGELGADVVVGSAQRFGVPMGFGGPSAGFMATAQRHARSLPGRLVGVTIDAAGEPAYRLALQTREQHIRREKATSNICTAQALLANLAAAYAAWHGPDGLTGIAARVHDLTTETARAVMARGLGVNDTFFDTLTVTTPGRADAVVAAAADRGINLRPVDADRFGLSYDETSGPDLVADVLAAIDAGTGSPGGNAPGAGADADGPTGLPPGAARTSAFLTHPNFHRYRTEHEMLRWLRRLGDRDLSLDRTMIPLGSCTMKLNAAAEMEPISWPEFADIHPYAPAEQTAGYRRLIGELEAMLVDITGYDRVSLQPNAGSQGEYAGLLAIRRYLDDQGQGHRDVCLIPSSAHGTNAASAVLAGMRVVVVACDDGGNIDLDDLRAKLSTHGDQVAALMITYPSTHGVYEETVTEVCDLLHTAGGQVYTDGANLNALVGVARPGRFGSDVSHLNLHKTFCIPHGGGGPGVGPVAVAAHLAPYLPGHPVVTDPEIGPDGTVSAAPWGSAGILPISWMYITMMGGDGLRRATEVAVLAANYVAARLNEHFPVLYTGAHGLVAHECIVDLRPITAATGVTNDDVAKRLADYGFHAPTMSFPVAGTLMIEPTESESLAELDRFCDAMIAIRGEIDEVASGAVAVEDSVLRHAPHTAAVVMADEWDRAYSRRQAAFPLPGMEVDKYFCPVGRVDNAHGDRNLSCSCPPLDAYEG